MSDRERIRRPEPARTDPVRNVAGVFRSGDAAAPASWGSATGAATGAASDMPAGAGFAAASPFAWPGDDPVSRAVRAGCDVVERAVRRGFGLGRDPLSGPPWTRGAPPGSWAGPSTGSWSTGQWIDAMTSALAQWTQWIDAWSAAARSVVPGAEPAPGAWPTPPPPPPPSPSPSPSPTGAAGALRLTVELRCARAASVELDLVPGAPAALEVHGLVAPAAAGAPPITDVAVAIAGGGVTVALGSVEHHPAGTYAGAVLSGGRACGTLTVRLT